MDILLKLRVSKSLSDKRSILYLTSRVAMYCIGMLQKITTAVLCFALTSTFAAHADDLGVTDNGLTQRAENFTMSYWPQLSLSNTDLLKFLNGVIGSDIMFYGGMISRSKFIGIQNAYLERWPERLYTLQPDTLSIFCDGGSSICKVSGIVNWDVSSPVRNARSTGQAHFDFLLLCSETSDHSNCIMSEESGSVISRASSKLTP